jgi:septal ring factor EnvC (AmiA/AmiB activator)
MKPVNTRELSHAYRTFLLYFLTFIVFALLCAFCFFATSKHELNLLGARTQQYDKLLYTREDVTAQFDLILQRLQSLSQYVQANATEMNNQAVLLNAIESSNQRVKGLLDDMDNNTETASFGIYRGITDHVNLLSGLKDSLSQTRFQIESLRSQLDACSRTNQEAARNLRGGF